MLPSIEKQPAGEADAAVIWLHGLGADGHDFEPIVPELRLPENGIRFIFPHAPSMPVTINNGYVMPAWYDILSMDIDRAYNREHLLASATAVTELIDREIERGIDSRRIVLAGFSQGGAVAYHAALAYPERLAGLLCLSCVFHTHDSIELSPVNRDIPILVCHGTLDPVVPEALGETSCSKLLELGYRVTYRTYPMEHSVCPEQIREISKWLQLQLSLT